MNRILLIGAGQIGSRHLQALSKVESPTKIVVVDPNCDSLEMSKLRYEQMSLNNKIETEYVQNFDYVNGVFDICIVATSSDVRSKILFELFKHCSVKHVILEKFLFQTIKEYYDVEALFKVNSVIGWVNCPNRVNPAYIALKENLGKNRVSYFVQGGNWGLLCNAVHYFDFLSFITGQYDYTFDLNGLDKNTVASKRKNFIEASGSIVGILPDRSVAVLYSDLSSSADLIQSIMCKNAQFSINQTKGTMRSAFLSNNWLWEEKTLKISYQSELTDTIVKNILEDGICGLPTYEQSCRIHMSLLPLLIKHFNLKDYLPVT